MDKILIGGICIKFSSIQEVRNQIPKTIHNFIDNKYSNVLILAPPPGTGKTYHTAKTITELYMNFAFLGAIHDSLEENISKPYNIMHLEGRSRLCTNEYHEIYSKNNVADSSYTCFICENKGICEYKQRLREFIDMPQPFVGVYQHFGIFHDILNKHYNLTVFDENFLDSMNLHNYYTNSDFITTERLVKKLDNEVIIKDDILNLLHELKSFSYTGKDLNIPKIFLNYSENEDIIEKFKWSYKRLIVDRIHDNQRVFPDIMSGILNYFNMDTDKKMITKKIINTKNFQQTYVEFNAYNFKLLDNFNRKMIILDATTPKQIYRNILNDKKISFYKPYVKSITNTYQLINSSYSMKMLSKQPIKNRIFKLCRNICNFHENEKVFIIIRKKFYKELKDYLKNAKNVILGWYGGVRGSNKFKEADIGVLVGAPYPNPEALKNKSILLKTNEEIVKGMECNEEMLQSAHRIRPLIKDKTWLYILSNEETGFLCNNMNKITLSKLEKKLRLKNEVKIN